MNAITHALDAEYVDPRPGSSPATLATLMTVPAPAASIGGSAACVSCITAVTLTSSWDCSTARLAVQNSPDGAESGVVDQHLDPGGQPVGDLGAVGGVGEVGGEHLDRRARLVVQFGGERSSRGASRATSTRS